MKDKHEPRINFAKPDIRSKLQTAMRTHDHCKEVAGVSRPGKTAKDRWLKQA